MNKKMKDKYKNLVKIIGDDDVDFGKCEKCGSDLVEIGYTVGKEWIFQIECMECGLKVRRSDTTFKDKVDFFKSEGASISNDFFCQNIDMVDNKEKGVIR